MGKPELVWFPIQLRLYKIYPIDHLEQVEVNIEGVKTKAKFEFIEIMDEFDPFPTLLGIDWEFDNNVVLKLKKRQMSFVKNSLRVVAPLDTYEGGQYNELMDEDAQSSANENVYKIMGQREDYINPTTDGELSWISVKSYDTESEDAMKRWQNNLYKVSSRRCASLCKGA
jgi:hypothetical protein